MKLTPAQRTVLRSGLPVESLHPQPCGEPLEVTPIELQELSGWASIERLVGFLGNALARGELAIVADASIASAERATVTVRESLLSGLRSSIAAEATAVTAVGVLRSVGVEPLLFKGLATAHQDYSDPGLRTFFDADVLVRRPDLPIAIPALLDAGFHRTSEPLAPNWERRFARATELRSDGGVELDLHASLATGYFGEVLDHDLVRSRTEIVDLGGVDCTTFDSTGRFLVSCYAIVLSRGRAFGSIETLPSNSW